MNDQIKELAEQAGIKFTADWGECYTGNVQLKRFAELVRQDEREEIAQWLSSGIRLDGLTTEPLILQFTVDLIEAIGKLIRERGE